MKVHSSGITNGHLDDRFGHHGEQFLHAKMPNRSFPLTWENLPENTVSLALTFIDYDAVPVCGFPWIHWTVANIDPLFTGLSENASVELDLLEGVNSWSSGIIPESSRLSLTDSATYGGCAPPDKAHRYDLTLYALDTTLDLKRGFYLNELLRAIDNHVLGQAQLSAHYTAKKK